MIQHTKLRAMTPAEQTQWLRETMEAPAMDASCQAVLARQRLLDFGADTCNKALALAKRKNADYGGNNDPLRNLRIAGSHGVAVRMTDKACRLLTLTERRHSGTADPIGVVEESVEDTCLDLINYAWLLLAVRAEEDK